MPKPDSQPAALAAQNLHKHYRVGSEDLHVLRGASITVKRGEWLAIVGASGSGKSTMLHLMGALDTPDRGKVLFDGQNVFDLSASGMNRYRNQQVGFVFQFYHLLPEFTAIENVAMPAIVASTSGQWRKRRDEIVAHAKEILDEMGLKGRENHRPNQLSGGEQQRVAIGRALINNPALLFADEPTGNLDKATSEGILDLLIECNRRHDTALVIVTHNTHIAERASRVVLLKDGVIVPAR